MLDAIWDELDSDQETTTTEILDEVPPSLQECAPGDLVWNDSGCVYVCTRSYPLAFPDSDGGLIHDPELPLSHLAPTFP